jgi:hypothetical protein
MPIPNKGFFDPDPPSELTDSVQHHQDRTDAIRAELEKADEEQERINAQHKENEEKRQKAAREQEVQHVENLVGLSRDQMTRDMLLDHIRKLRAEKPPEYVAPPRTPEQQKLFEAEQEAGRAAVAKAEAALQAQREAAAKAQAAQEVTKTVVHPNPSQSEIFPTVKSTLPPKPRR